MATCILRSKKACNTLTFGLRLFEVIPLIRSGRSHRPPGVRAVPYGSRCAASKAREGEKESNERFARRRIVRCSLSGLYFVRTQPFFDCPARAASACSRRSVRYYVSLVALETPHSGCPKAPPARREGSSVLFSKCCIQKPAKAKNTKTIDLPCGESIVSLRAGFYSLQHMLRLRCRAGPACSRWSVRYCVSLMALETPHSGCPKAPCSRWSVRYCVSLVSLATPYSGCPRHRARGGACDTTYRLWR